MFIRPRRFGKTLNMSMLQYFFEKREELNKMLVQTISFNDAYENFYHGFVVGVLANMHDHIVKSNREGGKGISVSIKSLSIFNPAVHA